MGCQHSKDVNTVAVPLRPTTPSFHAQNSKLWTNSSGSQANEFREELPSFVVSDSADLVMSSDGEPVHGMMSAFTFSFIQASETSSTNSSLSLSSFVSEEQTSPGPPESLTFAMTGDPIELQPIPEERSGPRDNVEASTTSTAEPQENAAPTPTESAVTQPEEESSPVSVAQTIESSVVSESATTETSELLVNELDASGVSGESSIATGDTRRSVTVSELSEGGEYILIETGAVVRQESVVDTVPEASQDEAESDAVERESIEAVAAAIVQEVVDGAVAGESTQQPRDRAALVASSSLQVEPSSTGSFALSLKTQPSENALVVSSRTPIYAIVSTSTDKGVVLYQIQLLDEVTDSAKWTSPLPRRYSRFSAMYLKLKDTKLPSVDKLPKLPRAGMVHFVRGRQSKKTIEERQQQFSNVLRYIAEHRELHDSAVFQQFLARE